MSDAKKYAGACGVCTDCGEWTEVLEPCCNAGVSFEGSVIWLEDLELEEEVVV